MWVSDNFFLSIKTKTFRKALEGQITILLDNLDDITEDGEDGMDGNQLFNDPRHKENYKEIKLCSYSDESSSYF